MLGRDCLLEAFRMYGVEYLFGNPGTTELPLMDGLVNYTDIKYILALHEDIAVGMAAGYAQASGKPGVVNLHITPGLAHGLGNLYDAWRARVPLLVTAGQHDSRLALQEPALAGDLVSMAKPFTKWSYEIRHPDEVAIAVQRAFKVAMTPPTGPVFLSLPADVMMAETSHLPIPLTTVHLAGNALAGAGEVVGQDVHLGVETAAELLIGAHRPVMIVGDGVAQSHAVSEVVRLAETVGCEVYTEHQSSALSFRASHPQFFGRGLPNGPYLQHILDGADVVMFAGVTSQAPLLYFSQPVLPAGAKVIHIDCSAWEIGKNNHVHVGIVGDIRSLIRAIAAACDAVIEAGEGVVERRARRLAVMADRQKARADKLRAEREAGRLQKPLSPAHIMAELNELWEDHMMLVDESVTTGRYVHTQVQTDREDSVIALKGGGLGYGMPAALGAQLARPDERVVAVIGDGSALYVIQALWNAAKYQLPVVYLIVNNASYMILKGGLRRLNGPAVAQGVYPGMDLVGPEVDFVACARGFGVEAVRVDEPDEVRPALETALRERRPYLIDFVIDREVKEFLQ
ncbi:thiamine pyrophosphate-binding protein [Alicyclobacillus curvatus]|nr:thiamine pyrophosphate-binding protein [Alicyclobacillus curvatus]